MEHAESIQDSNKKWQFPKRSNRYDADFKLQVVKKYLEESIPAEIIHQECGVCLESVGRWVRAYRYRPDQGEDPHALQRYLQCRQAALPEFYLVAHAAQTRYASGAAAGASQVKPPDFSRLAQDIAALSHGQDRTQGTGALYARYASGVSRRELQKMVEVTRHDPSTLHRQNLRRIRWNVPNGAWSRDPCEYGQRDATGAKVYLNQMQNLASRYKFNPMTGDVPCAKKYPVVLRKGNNSCRVYFTGKRTFTKWKRRDAYGWITNLQNDILSSERVQPQAAWRVTVEAWLKMKGFITVSINGKVLPNFF